MSPCLFKKLALSVPVLAIITRVILSVHGTFVVAKSEGFWDEIKKNLIGRKFRAYKKIVYIICGKITQF